MSSADNLCKQFGPRSGTVTTKCWAWSGSKLFDTLMVFLKVIFRKSWFLKKISRRQKSLKNFQGGQELDGVKTSQWISLGAIICWHSIFFFKKKIKCLVCSYNQEHFRSLAIWLHIHFARDPKFSQGSHRLEKYLNIQDCLEKSLKIKFALKSTWKTLKGLEKSLIFAIYRRIQ